MKITYFQDTDILYIEFRWSEVAETRERADIPRVTFEQVAA